MRILINGAGIAGMTLAALLKQRGLNPVLIEQASNFKHKGYMLGLYPLGSRVLHGLELYEPYREISIPTSKYQMGNAKGKIIKSFDFAELPQEIGEYRMITRPELVELLYSNIKDVNIEFNTTIQSLTQLADRVNVTLSNGKEMEFDLVVGADGIHSHTRKLLFGETPYYHTGWGGWVWWADPNLIEPETVSEYWGAGRLLGYYPTKKQVGVIACTPLSEAHLEQNEGRKAHILKYFSNLHTAAGPLLDAMPNDDHEMFFWKLSDTRAPAWSQGRVVLLGDAAAAFLPTAGVGASMAMESAAVLNDELSRCSKEYIPAAIDLYIKRRQKRVLAIQNESRKLARMMFIRCAALSNLRNQMMRFMTIKSLIKNINKAIHQPI